MKPTALFTLLIVAAYAVVAYAVVAYAQQTVVEPVNSLTEPTANYELVQSSRTMKECFLLNRFTGDVWVMVSTRTRPKWQLLPKENHIDDTIDPFRPCYQLSVSGRSAKGIYLMNVLTAATWIVLADANGDWKLGALEAVETPPRKMIQ